MAGGTVTWFMVPIDHGPDTERYSHSAYSQLRESESLAGYSPLQSAKWDCD